MKHWLVAGFAAVGIVASSGLARADLVTFDNTTGPTTFAAAGPTQTLTYPFSDVTAVFKGGVVLTNETSQTTDLTSVYATASFGDATLTNPLEIDFSAPIQNFQVDILNALAGQYRLSDNTGNVKDFSLATTGGSIATEGFAATGTEVTVQYLTAPTSYDFAIDNVTFDQPLGGTPTAPAAPLPKSATAGLSLLGLVGLTGAVRRRRPTVA